MKKLSIWLFIALALLYPALFYKVGAGVNVLLYNLILLLIAYLTQKEIIKNRYFIALGIGTTLLGIAAVWHASHWTIWVNSFLIFLLGGVLCYPTAKSLLYHFYKSLHNTYGVFDFSFSEKDNKVSVKTEKSNFKFGSFIKKISIYLVPLLLIGLFIRLYSKANEIFGDIMAKIYSKFEFLFDWIADFLPKLNVFWILDFIIGFFVARFLFQGIRAERSLEKEKGLNINIQRKFKKPTKFHGMKLLNENKAGIFLFAALNCILLFLNIIDVQYVWTSFTFTGETLRDFVHEGTYNLIVSIILGAAIVLYFFRGNLNFLKQNIWLKRLSVIWIAQNVFLTLSVLVRNYHYINHFNLAYKRIGLIFFCILIIWGLVIVGQKVYKARSLYFLSTRLMVAIACIFFTSAPWDWAKIITKYNLNHAGKAYVHYNFLQTLPDRCLPLLENNLEKAFKIEDRQRRIFNKNSTPNNMEDYEEEVKRRISAFKENFKECSWKEWTYAEQEAYEKLQRGDI